MKVFIETIHFQLIDATTKKGNDFLKGKMRVMYVAFLNNMEISGKLEMPYEGIIDIPLMEYKILQLLQNKQ